MFNKSKNLSECGNNILISLYSYIDSLNAIETKLSEFYTVET